MCTLSTSERQKRLKTTSFLTHLTSKRASRHNSVHFFWHRNFQKWSVHMLFCTFWLGNVLGAATACTFSTSQLPKVVRTCAVLCILTWKGASRHNSVHFFDIATSKSGPYMCCFVHFELEMCFAPQPGVFCTFWLGNVLRATMVCTFLTSQLPKVVRTCAVLYILTWKCAWRHNGVHFFRHLNSKSGPYMCCFVHFDLEMCFAPQPGVFWTFWLGTVLGATTACTFSTSQFPKVVRTWSVLCILTWKGDSRHNSVHFFDISTSKSGPYMCCFVHFDLEMCLAPQWCAFFRHRNFQKWSVHVLFCTFWLGKVLRATTWSVLYILTWKCASRHNDVHFFDMATAKSGPYMWCFVHFDLEMCLAPQQRALFGHLNFQKWSVHVLFLCILTWKCAWRRNSVHFFSTSQLPKVVRTCAVWCILTWKGASRHNSVHFFDISTSKSGPYMCCFVHFDLEMCLAPQWCALFRHRNFQKWSVHVLFCTFWLGNVLRATTAWNFFMSHLTAWLRTRRFSEPTFRPSRATNHWKSRVNRDFATFSRTCLFFLLTLSRLWSSHCFSPALWLFPPRHKR